MVINDKLKYFGKIIKNRNRSVIVLLPFLNTGTTAVFFPQSRESDTS
jgi:hypothetical protein